MAAGGMLTLGIIIGAILALFCVFVVSAKDSNGRVANAELEAWREWQEWVEWYKAKTEKEMAGQQMAGRQIVEEEFRKMGAVELPMAESWQDIAEHVKHNGKGVIS